MLRLLAWQRWLLAFLAFKYKAHHIVTGFAINTFASAVTVFLLQTFFGSSGSYQPGNVVTIPTVTILLIDRTPIGPLLSGHSLIVRLALLVVIPSSIVSIVRLTART